jgi:mono/diheme cytochrome c family protein
MGDNCAGCHTPTMLPADHPQSNCAGCHPPAS